MKIPWGFIARFKVRFFWTIPIVNFLMLITANLGVIYLVIKQGRAEAIYAIPALFIGWLILFIAGWKKLLREEISFNWNLSDSWREHIIQQRDILERLDRIEEKIGGKK